MQRLNQAVRKTRCFRCYSRWTLVGPSLDPRCGLFLFFIFANIQCLFQIESKLEFSLFLRRKMSTKRMISEDETAARLRTKN